MSVTHYFLDFPYEDASYYHRLLKFNHANDMKISESYKIIVIPNLSKMKNWLWRFRVVKKINTKTKDFNSSSRFDPIYFWG